MNEQRPVRRRFSRWPAGAQDRGLRRRARGFTMLELLLAIGIVAIIGAFLIGGSRAMVEQPASADDVFWKAVMATRKAALLADHDVRLAFADDREHGKRFTMTEGGVTKDFPVTASADLQVNFLSVQPRAGSAVILAGQVVDTESLPFVTFYGDGTCTAFRVQVRIGVDSHVLSIDPWTCAPVLVPADRL